MDFPKAVKEQTYAKIAIFGPAGAGKTKTSLEWATKLAELEGTRVAHIDTEGRRALDYATDYDFDHGQLTAPFAPERFIESMTDAVESGHGVIIVDSLSHAWNGAGGILEIVDAAVPKYSGNSKMAWKDATPRQRRLMDAIVQAPAHIIVTMRSAQEYAEVVKDNGSKGYERVGTKPTQREDSLYEFSVIAEIDLRHVVSITKDTSEVFTQGSYEKPDGSMMEDYWGWLRDGEAMATLAEIRSMLDAIKELGSKENPNDEWKRMGALWRSLGCTSTSMTEEQFDLLGVELDTITEEMEITKAEEAAAEEAETDGIEYTEDDPF